MRNLYQFHTLEHGQTTYHGISTENLDAPLCLHVHGTWGNFYENPFVLAITETYVQAGYAYASVNTPGHDGGSIHEDFDASLPVLQNWIELLSPQGNDLILQGHSLGALKLIRMLTNPQYHSIYERVRAVVLLSPFDLVAFYGGQTAVEIADRRQRTQQLAQTSGEESLVHSDVFDLWPLSTKTFLNATEENGAWDLFPTRKNSVGKLADINKPLFIGLGSEDFAATPSVSDIANLLADGVPSAYVETVAGAPHNFASKEIALANAISRFLAQVDI